MCVHGVHACSCLGEWGGAALPIAGHSGSLEGMMSANQLDGYYFLTQNGKPVHHSEAHLEPENRLGRAISAIQSDNILIADTDPNTGIEYGELT